MKNYLCQKFQIEFIVNYLQQRNIKTSEKINNGLGLLNIKLHFRTSCACGYFNSNPTYKTF